MSCFVLHQGARVVVQVANFIIDHCEVDPCNVDPVMNVLSLREIPLVPTRQAYKHNHAFSPAHTCQFADLAHCVR